MPLPPLPACALLWLLAPVQEVAQRRRGREALRDRRFRVIDGAGTCRSRPRSRSPPARQPTPLADPLAGDDTTASSSGSPDEQPTSGADPGDIGRSNAEAPLCMPAKVMGTPLSPHLVLVLDRSWSPMVPPTAPGAPRPPELFETHDESVHSIVQDAFTIDGIPTYVVGVGIEDPLSSPLADGNPDATKTFDWLNTLATEGGKPRSAGATGVQVDGVPIPFVSDCATESGWMYTHPEGPFDVIRAFDVVSCIDKKVE